MTIRWFANELFKLLAIGSFVAWEFVILGVFH